MKRSLFAGAALLLTVSSAAFAANPPAVADGKGAPDPTDATTSPTTTAGTSNDAPMPPATATAAKPISPPAAGKGALDGGNPTELAVTTPGTTSETTPANGTATKPTMASAGTATTSGMFIAVPAKDDLSSSVIGLDIYNSANQDVGTIKDIAFGPGGVKAYIIGVGGFLGMGDHYVAVRPSAITLSRDNSSRKWHATMDANADQLKAAPEYKYSTAY